MCGLDESNPYTRKHICRKNGTVLFLHFQKCGLDESSPYRKKKNLTNQIPSKKRNERNYSSFASLTPLFVPMFPFMSMTQKIGDLEKRGLSPFYMNQAPTGKRRI